MDKIPHNPKRRWDAIIERVPKGVKLVGCEVGVWQGRTSRKLLEALPNLFLYLVDRWCVPPLGDTYWQGSVEMVRSTQKEFDKVYNDTLKAVKAFKGRYKIIKKDSIIAAFEIPDNSLDFCFLDGDHSYPGISKDISAWLLKVKKGGLICGHDYENPNTKTEVKRAVDEKFGSDIELSYNKTWFHRVK